MEQPPPDHPLAPPDMTWDPLSILIFRTVRAGSEAAFEQLLHDFVERSLRVKGQLGVQVLRPVPGSGSREYGILRRFSGPDARKLFYSSELFADWIAQVTPLCEGEQRKQELSGLETWFTLPGREAVVPPPRWKMALVTFVGVFPASALLPPALSPLTAALPPLGKVAVHAAAIVAALTWIIMPLLTRLLRPWLFNAALVGPAAAAREK